MVNCITRWEYGFAGKCNLSIHFCKIHFDTELNSLLSLSQFNI